MLAIGLSTRMGFNPRIFQYGFVQAPLAVSVGLGTILYTLPLVFGLNCVGKWCLRGICLIAILFLSNATIARSQAFNKSKNLSIGSGSDEVFAYSPDFHGAASSFSKALNTVQKVHQGGTILVLPEGCLINYLLRTDSPLPEFQFLPAALVNGQATDYVERLNKNPPELVVLLPRDTRKHGVLNLYGENSDCGAELLTWISEHYKPLAGEGNPLDPRDTGWAVLARRCSPVWQH